MISEKIVKQIVTNYGTPAYIFDLVELNKRILDIREILGKNIALCYAMKANPFLVPYIEPLVDKFEVCSPGEYFICKKENIKQEKIVMSGVYKSTEDIENTFMDDFCGTYTIESLNQYKLLVEYSKKEERRINVIIRLTSGNQFGMDEKDICKIISEVNNNKFLKIAGIHFFSGTQKKNMYVLQKELEELNMFCEYLDKTYGFKVDIIEYGAGLFFDYFSKKGENYDGIKSLKELLECYEEKYQFTIELGRYLSASCGQYVTSVVDVKTNKDRNYCIVDGGIHQLNYHGQMLGVKVPSVRVLGTENGKGKKNIWNVCGALCTIHDILLKNYETDDICVGDIFIFDDAGAYSITEAPFMFLSRDLPKILMVDENDNIVLIRKQMPTYYINSRDERI